MVPFSPDPGSFKDLHPKSKFLAVMVNSKSLLSNGQPNVVGSFGSRNDMSVAESANVQELCDIAEIRLDLLAESTGRVEMPSWRHLEGIPLLFTARRMEEGGAIAISATERASLLESVLGEAACIDIEVASIRELSGLIETIASSGIPWVASFHDFNKLPESRILEDAAKRALGAGAGAFKVAARLNQPADIARLAEFQLADHGLPVATMGMGPLATVSRLLCAQCGSVLNYGYIGNKATAPGQWQAGLLKQAIADLPPFRV
jgi:3-dehydroquinate dehydratase-1